MAQGDQDKTEEPTAYRLEEARRRGEVSKSADATGIVMMVVFAAAFAMSAGWLVVAIADATRRMILLAGQQPVLGGALVHWIGQAYAPVAQALTPLALALVVAAIAANLLQIGFIFSTEPLKADFKRLDPNNAIKRIFSFRTVWEFLKLVFKMLCLAGLCALLVHGARGAAESAASASAAALPGLFMDVFVDASIWVLLVFALMAVGDMLFTRREYMQKMRTSRRELKEEIRKRDGDPAVKSKQKQQIRELLKKTRSLARVAEADVVLTNPTHYAVAIQYRPGTMRAPVVLSKGTGFFAARIRRVAARSGVAIERSPALARLLYRECEIDAPVPESLYPLLAPVYRALWARRAGAGA